MAARFSESGFQIAFRVDASAPKVRCVGRSITCAILPTKRTPAEWAISLLTQKVSSLLAKLSSPCDSRRGVLAFCPLGFGERRRNCRLDGAPWSRKMVHEFSYFC